MKKILFFIFLFILLPQTVCGQSLDFENDNLQKAEIIDSTENFIRVETKLGERITVDQSVETDQHLSLRVGDKVLVNKLIMENGEERFMIVDVIRRAPIYFLIFLFIVLILVLYRKQGLKALLGLLVSLLIIIFILAPMILAGFNPLFSAIVIGGLAFVCMTYITYGRNKKSHVAVIGTLISLSLVGVLSYLFANLSSLSGFVTDEATFLVTMGYEINMRGLLLAAIIIGTLGVLDDVTVGQASVVQELKEVDQNLSGWQLYNKAMRVGRDHVSSMINTLFFAYIGASFPLFLLFTIGAPPFDSLGAIINNEIVATEIVRTLVGSISLLLAVPVTTWVAVKFNK